MAAWLRPSAFIFCSNFSMASKGVAKTLLVHYIPTPSFSFTSSANLCRNRKMPNSWVSLVGWVGCLSKMCLKNPVESPMKEGTPCLSDSPTPAQSKDARAGVQAFWSTIQDSQQRRARRLGEAVQVERPSLRVAMRRGGITLCACVMLACSSVGRARGPSASYRVAVPHSALISDWALAPTTGPSAAALSAPLSAPGTVVRDDWNSSTEGSIPWEPVLLVTRGRSTLYSSNLYTCWSRSAPTSFGSAASLTCTLLLSNCGGHYMLL